MNVLATPAPLETEEDIRSRLGRSFEAFGRITADLEGAYERLRERAERIDLRLAETNRRLAAILANLPVGVIVADDVGGITHLNPAAAGVLGIDAEETVGLPLEDLRTAAGELLLADGASTPPLLLRELETVEGVTRIVRLTSADVTGSDGAVQGRILALEDLTELEDLRKEVHRLDKLAAMGEMSARLAHQIRNPLNGMQGFAGLLARGLPDHPSLLSHAEKVLAGARDLNRIVTNMLALARPSTAAPKPCPLARTAQAAVAWLEGQGPMKHEIRVRHDAPAARVLADRFPLEEAVRNLLQNASEATPPGGVIRVRTRVRNGWGEVTVADTGAGVPVALRNRLFEPFVTGRERGTGLGLAIVNSVAEQSGGELTLCSSGRGARFRLRLTRASDEEGGLA
jgi:PAS domain S-box-containing protein